MSNSSEDRSKARPAMLSKGLKSVLGGQVSFGRATREAFRRGRAAVRSRRERGMLGELASQPPRLRPEFQSLSASDLLKHFRDRARPCFFPGFESATTSASRQRELFPDETEQLIAAAEKITGAHRWPLLGFGEKEFGERINWHRDPLSGRIWPLDYHADIPLWHTDGSDIRVLWELNRLGHLITLARAAAVTNRAEFSEEILAHVESWREQNPVGLGANWSCAMEVALRAMNLLAVFALLRSSPQLNEERLQMFLTTFDQHGAHIRRNLEFSYLATSNHYLSDVAGLLWLGIMLPELVAAEEWRTWALREMLHEMDKQILPDGADYEGSTGYHCFVLELLLYSFLLCRTNQIEIPEKHWQRLKSLLTYLRVILRPDGLLPLIGDTDGGHLLPIVSHNASDHAYLLALGAAIFNEAQFKPAKVSAPLELLWLLGEEGLRNDQQLASSNAGGGSQAFPDAGTYVMRHEDSYLLFNANGAHTGRPASHRHNDALSIEVSAGGRAFIVDPGSFVYTADLHERHLFRSTAYHSTVEVDRVEQNSIDENLPFAIGNQAVCKVLEWQPGFELEMLAAEHCGYQRLPRPVTHSRRVVFNHRKRYWFVSDKLKGEGEHELLFRFHFAPGLETTVRSDGVVRANGTSSGVRLLIHAAEVNSWIARPPNLETRFSSSNYGEKEPSIAACWQVRTALPYELNFVIVPVHPGEDEDERMSRAMDFND